MGRPWPEHFRRDGRAKVSYASMAEATEAAQHRNMHNMRAYQCGFCSKYHLARASSHKSPSKKMGDLIDW